MEQNNKIGNYQLEVEPYHVDFTGKLNLGVLGNHLLNCAGYHANERGFGMAVLNEEDYTWVLSRLAIEIFDMPKRYEKFSVRTWVERVYRLFTDRNFALVDEAGNKVGYARSVWAMISMQSRKPADLLQLHNGDIADYVCEEEPCPIAKPSRVKVTSKEPASVIHAVFSDIDINGHVNSIRYIEHVLDLFNLDWYAHHAIRRFEIAYVNESYYGDELQLYCDAVSELDYNVEIRKAGGEVVCRSKVVFVES